MAAQDNLSKQQFFHGSQHSLKVGDTVKPHNDFAWASTNPEVASSYAASEGLNAEKHQPVLFGTVYKVTPLKNDVVRNPGADKRFGIYASPTGFKVTGMHSLVPNNQLDTK
jgi:hypothetical protein